MQRFRFKLRPPPLLSLLRGATWPLLGLALIGGAAYGAYQTYLHFAIRPIQVCTVTDFAFRTQYPNWEDRLKLWFGEVNRVFLEAGVEWRLSSRGDNAALQKAGNLSERRAALLDRMPCQADVIVGFSSQPAGGAPISVSPFSPVVLIATTPSDSDALSITKVARGLAHLFAVPEPTGALITTGEPHDGILDGKSLQQVRDLRYYDLSKGVAALPGKWEPRAAAALTQALAGKNESPAAEAHRILGRAYVDGRRYSDAVGQFRLATRSSPRDAVLRLELAVALNADAQHDDAIVELRESARLDPEDARPRGALGAILLNLRRYSDAIDELRTAIRLDPGNPNYHSLLGQALTPEVGGAEEATASLQTALRAKPRDVAILHALAELNSAAEVMQPELAKLQEAVGRNPNSSAAHLDLGLGLARAANTRGARQEIEKSIRLDPNNGRARLSMAQLHFMAGDFASAHHEAQAAIAVGVKPSRQFLDALSRKLQSR